MKIVNTPKRNLWISYGIAFLGVGMSLFPEFSNVYSSDDEIKWILLGMTIALSGWLTGLLMFKEKARIADEAKEESRVVAKWVYDPSAWRRRIAEEKKSKRSADIKLSLTVIALSSAVFIPILIFAESKLIPAIAYIVFLSFGITGIYQNYSRIRNLREQAYVVITRDGAIINGEVVCWRGRGRGFEIARYEEETDVISVHYSNYYGKGALDKTVAIPIPDYIEIDADEVVKKINMQDRMEYLID